MKITAGDIIMLHKFTISDKHMMYGSRDMKRDKQNFLSFWTLFCPFNPVIFHFGLFFTLLPPNRPKNQNIEKMKKTPRDINILHVYQKL